jgi:hypothetical protein
MRKFLALGALAIALPAAAAPTQTYLNARYGYSIAYPSDLKAEPESDNGDGRVFTSADGSVEARVWANYNATDETPGRLAADAASDCTSAPTYHRVAKGFVAISCRKGADILYQKTLIHKDLLATFEITYPAADHARWDAVVAQMGGSLRAP